MTELYMRGGGTFYAVLEGGYLHIEGPLERGMDPEEDGRESVVRLFIDHDDARAYRDYLTVMYGSAVLIELTLQDVWSMIPVMEETAVKLHDAPLRVEVCSIDEDGWPATVDTLHSVYVLWS